MKVLHIATSVNGGAGRSAYRLHESLLSIGIESSFLSLDGIFPEKSINCYKYENIPDNLPKKIHRKLNRILKTVGIESKEKKQRENIIEEYHSLKDDLICEIATLPYGLEGILQQEVVKAADIINLHWVSGFVDYQYFFQRCKKPIIWTLHDMNPFQGLFHYKQDELSNRVAEKLNQQVRDLKERSIQKSSNIQIVTPSRWLSTEAHNSRAFAGRAIRTIQYSLERDIFYDRGKALRTNLKIPSENVLIFCIAQNLDVPRKGFDLLLNALESLQSRYITVAIAGNFNQSISIPNLDIRQLGAIYDDNKLAELYSAADVFVLPSREDNLPNVMLESFACGTPVIGFPIGGVKDFVIPYETGLLAESVTYQSLALIIDEFVENRFKFSRKYIREFANEWFNHNKQGRIYQQLYSELLKHGN